MSRMLREITLYSQRRPLVSGCSTRQERDMEARMVGTILLTVSHIKLVKRGLMRDVVGRNNNCWNPTCLLKPPRTTPDRNQSPPIWSGVPPASPRCSMSTVGRHFFFWKTKESRRGRSAGDGAPAGRGCSNTAAHEPAHT